MNDILPHQPEDSDREAALADFFATVRTGARESDAAVLAAKPALERIAQAIVGSDSGQALRVRSILLSLYTGGAVLTDVSDLMTLDWSLRQDLCAVLLAFGHGEFGYDYMKTAFEDAGDRNARWFLGAAPDPLERLREALVFAKPGPLTTTPGTLSERGVGEFLASLFQGMPVDLMTALKGLDAVRVALVLDLMSDFLAGRFDNNAAELVHAHSRQAVSDAGANRRGKRVDCEHSSMVNVSGKSFPRSISGFRPANRKCGRDQAREIGSN